MEAAPKPRMEREFKGTWKHKLFRLVTMQHADRAKYYALPEEERAVLPHVAVTKDGTFSFIKNSKSGCTSVANLLWMYDHGSELNGNIHHSVRRYFRYKKLLSTRHNLDKTFLFSTVRDPARRAVSGFFNFFVERNNQQSGLHWDAIAEFGFLKKDDLLYRFDVFLDYVEASLSISPLRTDRHFRPQNINIGEGVFNLDYVAHLENLQEDLTRIGEMAGAALPPLSSLSVTRRNKSGSSDFRPSAGQTRRIEQLYARDYELYGY